MEIEIDYNPTPSNTYFISVTINKDEAISFDNTSKGHRIIKQKLIEKKDFPIGGKFSGEWDAIIIKDKKFSKKYHVKWIDLDKKDWVNNEIWETLWEKPILEQLNNKLLYYSRFISDNFNNLGKFQEKLSEFESLLSGEITKYII